MIIISTILNSPHPGPPPLGEGVFCSSPQRGEAGRGAGRNNDKGRRRVMSKKTENHFSQMVKMVSIGFCEIIEEAD